MTDLLITDFETVLTTTRAVRRRLDLTRPVPEASVRRALEIAVQAPTGGNAQDWRFVLVGDPAVKAAIGEVYARCFDRHVRQPLLGGLDAPEVRGRLDTSPSVRRVLEGAEALAGGIGRMPWLVLACATRPSPEHGAAGTLAGVYGSVFPAVWSLCLALRAQGLGSIITTLHLHEAEAVAEILGIPAGVTQCCLVPVAHTQGTEFRPAPRRPLDEVVYLDRWEAACA